MADNLPAANDLQNTFDIQRTKDFLLDLNKIPRGKARTNKLRKLTEYFTNGDGHFGVALIPSEGCDPYFKHLPNHGDYKKVVFVLIEEKAEEEKKADDDAKADDEKKPFTYRSSSTYRVPDAECFYQILCFGFKHGFLQRAIKELGLKPTKENARKILGKLLQQLIDDLDIYLGRNKYAAVSFVLDLFKPPPTPELQPATPQQQPPTPQQHRWPMTTPQPVVTPAPTFFANVDLALLSADERERFFAASKELGDARKTVMTNRREDEQNKLTGFKEAQERRFEVLAGVRAAKIQGVDDSEKAAQENLKAKLQILEDKLKLIEESKKERQEREETKRKVLEESEKTFLKVAEEDKKEFLQAQQEAIGAKFDEGSRFIAYHESHVQFTATPRRLRATAATPTPVANSFPVEAASPRPFASRIPSTNASLLPAAASPTPAKARAPPTPETPGSGYEDKKPPAIEAFGGLGTRPTTAQARAPPTPETPASLDRDPGSLGGSLSFDFIPDAHTVPPGLGMRPTLAAAPTAQARAPTPETPAVAAAAAAQATAQAGVGFNAAASLGLDPSSFGGSLGFAFNTVRSGFERVRESLTPDARAPPTPGVPVAAGVAPASGQSSPDSQMDFHMDFSDV